MSSSKRVGEFWKLLSPYDPSRYHDTRLDKLAVVGIHKLISNGIECTFDNAVVVLHKLFPEKFSLVSFPEYPDSIRVDTTLRLDCRHSRYVTGNRVKGFALTELGKLAAEDSTKFLESRSRKSYAPPPLGPDRRNRFTRLLAEVRNSDAFKKYQAGQSLSRFDVCDVLHGSLDTNDKVLIGNLQTLVEYANKLKPLAEYKELADSVLKFLSLIESHWKVIMNGSA